MKIFSPSTCIMRTPADHKALRLSASTLAAMLALLVAGTAAAGTGLSEV